MAEAYLKDLCSRVLEAVAAVPFGRWTGLAMPGARVVWAR